MVETKLFNEIHLSCHRDALILHEPDVADCNMDFEKCVGCGANSRERKPNYCWRCGCPWKQRSQAQLASEEAVLAEDNDSKGEVSRLALHADKLHLSWIGGSVHSGARKHRAKIQVSSKHTPKVKALAMGRRHRDNLDSFDSSHNYAQCRSDPYAL